MPNALLPEVREQARTLYLSGEPPVTISQKTGASSQLISTWANRFKWREQREAINSQVAKVMSKAVTSSLMKKSNSMRDKLASELHAQADALLASPVKGYSDLPNDGQGRVAVLKTLSEASKTVFGWDDPAISGLLGAGLRDLDSIDVEEVSNPPQLTDSKPDKPV